MDTSPDTDPLPVLAYRVFSDRANYLQSFVLLLFRLSFGWMMYLSGYRHLHDVQAMVDKFVGWGVPFPRFNVYVSGMTEVAGGVLIAFGFATRLISIPLIFNFIVAMATAGKVNFQQLAHGGQLIPDYHPGRLSALEAILNDTAFPFFLASMLTLAFGAGKASIDYLLLRAFRKLPPPKP